MAEVKSGPAPYIYVCTRLRVRKSKLIPPEEYQRMLNMSLNEITRFIEESQYKREIDELEASFKGVDLVETALSWNLAKEYQNVLDITPGYLKGFTEGYLRKRDIANVLTILKGKLNGFPAGKIKEVLIPAGEFDRVFLDRLLAEDSPERMAELMRGRKIYPVFARELPAALQSGNLYKLENALYREYYEGLLEIARSGVKGGSLFLSWILLDIDITNIRNLFRLRVDEIDEDARDVMIPGATFSVEELQRLNLMKDQNEFIDALLARIRVRPLRELLETLREKKNIGDVEIRLIRVQLDQMERMAKLNPFSIHPILEYLEKKRYEVFNLRAIARGKEAKLPADRIAGFLVM